LREEFHELWVGAVRLIAANVADDAMRALRAALLAGDHGVYGGARRLRRVRVGRRANKHTFRCGSGGCTGAFVAGCEARGDRRGWAPFGLRTAELAEMLDRAALRTMVGAQRTERRVVADRNARPDSGNRDRVNRNKSRMLEAIGRTGVNVRFLHH